MKSLFPTAAFLFLAITSFAQQGTPTQPIGPVRQPQSSTYGDIVKISSNSIDLKLGNGSTLTVTITPETKFRKNATTAKLSDFVVGDRVVVHGEQTGPASWQATNIVEGLTPQRKQELLQQLGKTLVSGSVKTIDANSLTITRDDNSERTVQLTPQTQVLAGPQQTIPMSDLKPGMRVVARTLPDSTVCMSITLLPDRKGPGANPSPGAPSLPVQPKPSPK